MTDRRVSDISSCIEQIITDLPYTTARKLASFVGKIISLLPVTGHIAQLRTRFSCMTITDSNHWDKIKNLYDNNEVIEELFFWRDNLKVLNKRFIFQYSIPQMLIFSDASHIGCGAWTAECGGMQFQHIWSEEDRGKSSTWRELKAVALAIRAFAPKLKGHTIKVFTDNTGVEVILRKGSMKFDLQCLSLDIAKLCLDLHTCLQVQWIPRLYNQIADDLSKEIDFDDWGVSHLFFSFMDNLWGPHTVDRFADDYNAKLPNFNSKFWCPNSSQVDTFSVSWELHNNWLVPPIALIGQAIKHVRTCHALATLVVPYWPSAPFWPLLFSRLSSFSFIVKQTIKFADSTHIFVQGRNSKSIFGTTNFRSEVICVKLDARRK